jgi:hypothetical protein
MGLGNTHGPFLLYPKAGERFAPVITHPYLGRIKRDASNCRIMINRCFRMISEAGAGRKFLVFSCGQTASAAKSAGQSAFSVTIPDAVGLTHKGRRPVPL